MHKAKRGKGERKEGRDRQGRKRKKKGWNSEMKCERARERKANGEDGNNFQEDLE